MAGSKNNPEPLCFLHCASVSTEAFTVSLNLICQSDVLGIAGELSDSCSGLCKLLSKQKAKMQRAGIPVKQCSGDCSESHIHTRRVIFVWPFLLPLLFVVLQ